MKYILSIVFGIIISSVVSTLVALPLCIVKIYDDFAKNARIFMFLFIWFFMMQIPIWFATVYEYIRDKI